MATNNGIVVKSTGSHYVVQSDGNYLDCVARGKFRLSGLRTTNPIAVGDYVQIKEPEAEGEPGLITSIHSRKNYIIRRSVNLSKEAHIIAANLDQAVMVVTLSRPRTSMGFIDRFLVTAEAYHVPVVILVNKSDDITSLEEKADLAILKDTFASAGYPVIAVSALQDESLDPLVNLLKDKVSLISGHSGVGKSTLINRLCPNLDLRTASISETHRKGQHTTTFAEMHSLPFGGSIIDTPGIKGFGLVDMEAEELPMLFPEMRRLLPECKFYNCRHLNEPGCAVIKALENGQIFPSRYNSYLSMLEDMEGNTGKYREDDYK